MCGITGFTGQSPALPILLSGLASLEYRGYDSAGVTLVDNQSLLTQKCKGRLANLEEQMDVSRFVQTTGIGHTRWATHGIPSQLNAHPHTNADDTISVVHNGIIENYQSIRKELENKGVTFQSQTDSEVIVHLLDQYYTGNMLEAMQKTIAHLEGSFAICVVSTHHPDEIFVAKQNSPMVLAHNDNGSYCASDIPAILEYTKDVLILDDGQMAHLTKEGIDVFDFQGRPVKVETTHIPFDLEAAQKGGYDTFMLKEIYEQPMVIRETLRGRIQDGKAHLPTLDVYDFSRINRIHFIACGTAYHAGLYAKSLLETWTNKLVTCTPASEFRYGNVYCDENSLCIFISQSGETADTLAALKMCKDKGAQTLGIVNVLGSSISRLADKTLFTCAGPEIAVASTKAFTTQLVLLALVSIEFAKRMGFNVDHEEEMIADLERMDTLIEEMLDMDGVMETYSKYLKDQHDAYFIGRCMDYVAVLEGALKLKEVSYIHADAYYAGELKHGPIALIDKDTVVVALATQPSIAAKTISNVEETIARGAKVILITTQDQQADHFNDVIRIPEVSDLLSAIPVTVLTQLFAYHAAILKGCDVDKPRNLAKSVTVE